MTTSMLASLVLNYDNLTDAKYLLKLGVIIAATKGSDLFGTFPPEGSPEKLEEKRDQFKVAFDGALDKSQKMIGLRNATRKETDVVIYTMGHHIQSHCQGDVVKLEKSGFDLRHPRAMNANRATPPPTSPTTWLVEAGRNPDELKFKLDHPRGAAFTEIWATTGDPSIEANWTYVGGFPGFEGYLDNFKIDTMYLLKARFVGKGGKSSWSNIITFLVK